MDDVLTKLRRDGMATITYSRLQYLLRLFTQIQTELVIDTQTEISSTCVRLELYDIFNTRQRYILTIHFGDTNG